MTLDEVLALKIEKKSIKKIESYLAKEDNTSLSYYRALAFKASVLYFTDNKSEAFKILLDYVNKEIGQARIYFIDVLIDIYLNQEDFAKTLKYIELKNELLSPLDSYKHTFDLIKYYVKRQDLENARKYILELIDDDIDIKSRAYITRILLDYTYNKGLLEEFDKHYNYLYDYYTNNNLLENLEEINLLKLKLYYSQGLYDKTLDFTLNANLDFLTVKSKIIFYTYQIKILIKLNNLRKASIIDSSAEKLVKDNINDCKEEVLEYYNTTLELYEGLENNYSINYITDIIKNINLEKEKKEKKQKSNFKEFNLGLIENEINIKEEEKEEKEVELKEFNLANSDRDKTLVSKDYKKLNAIFDTILNIDPYLEFREILRLLLIDFSSGFKFDEAFLYIEDNTSYLYKNKKVYDKTSVKELPRTINFRCYELAKEVVIHNLKSTYYNLDIVTGELSSYQAVCAFPIKYNLKTKGSIAFFFSDDIIDNNYEFYKMISSIINTIYSYKYYSKLEEKRKGIVNILEDKLDYGFKCITLDSVLINKVGLNIYNIKSEETELNDFYNLIKKEDRYILKNAINSLLLEEKDNIKIKYHLIDDKQVEDNLYLADNNTIYSYFNDITTDSQNIKNLENKVSNSSLVDVYSYKKLMLDYDELFKDKDKTLVILDSSNYDTYLNLYGFEFASDLIVALSRLLIDHQKDFDYALYHLESVKFILILNYNDKRKVLKQMKLLSDLLAREIRKINKRVSLKIYTGCYKALKGSKSISLKDAMDFATEALIDAKAEDEKAVIYSNLLYEKKYFNDLYYEIELSEALDNNKLISLYTPIYDINQSKILGYTYNLSLDNTIIDEANFRHVVSLRNLEYQVDKYLIEHVVSDLKAFYQKKGYFMNIFIHINAKTLKEEAFIPFLSNLFNFYKVSSSLISFIVEGDIVHNKVLDILYKSGVDLGTTSLDNLFKYNLDTIYLDNNIYSIDEIENISKSINKRIIILNLNNLKEIDKIKNITSYCETGKDSRKYSLSNLINKSAT